MKGLSAEHYRKYPNVKVVRSGETHFTFAMMRQDYFVEPVDVGFLFHGNNSRKAKKKKKKKRKRDDGADGGAQRKRKRRRVDQDSSNQMVINTHSVSSGLPILLENLN